MGIILCFYDESSHSSSLLDPRKGLKSWTPGAVLWPWLPTRSTQRPDWMIRKKQYLFNSVILVSLPKMICRHREGKRCLETIDWRHLTAEHVTPRRWAILTFRNLWVSVGGHSPGARVLKGLPPTFQTLIIWQWLRSTSVVRLLKKDTLQYYKLFQITIVWHCGK